MKRYAIWNKMDPIITPIGEILTPQQWMLRYPVAKLENITVVCGAGEINGSFFGTLGAMKQNYENAGVDLSNCSTNEEILELIETFEDELNNPNNNITAEERIAAALEAQNLMNMEDVE